MRGPPLLSLCRDLRGLLFPQACLLRNPLFRPLCRYPQGGDLAAEILGPEAPRRAAREPHGRDRHSPDRWDRSRAFEQGGIAATRLQPDAPPRESALAAPQGARISQRPAKETAHPTPDRPRGQGTVVEPEECLPGRRSG